MYEKKSTYRKSNTDQTTDHYTKIDDNILTLGVRLIIVLSKEIQAG